MEVYAEMMQLAEFVFNGIFLEVNLIPKLGNPLEEIEKELNAEWELDDTDFGFEDLELDLEY